MVCPLVFLKDRSSAYSGLFDCEHPKPDWWSSAPVRTVVTSEVPPLVEVTAPRRHPTLFDNLREEPEEAEASRQHVPPELDREALRITGLQEPEGTDPPPCPGGQHRPPDPDRAGVERRIMTPAAFSNAADIPAARLDGLIARIQRLLNVDGYEILTLNRNENKIELNVARLKRQFDLD